MTMSRLFAPVTLAAALAVAACSRAGSEAKVADSAIAAAPGGTAYAYQRVPLDTSHQPGTIIDSVFPMPEMIRRFRADLPEVRQLIDGEVSRQALVAKFVQAVATKDKKALGHLTLSRAEFAYVYFPNSSDATAANGLSPQLRWNGITLNSEKGITRALDRVGGKPLTLESLDCPNPPTTSGAMTLHDGCTVRIAATDGTKFSGRLFGSIIEFGGRFKFVGYANDM